MSIALPEFGQFSNGKYALIPGLLIGFVIQKNMIRTSIYAIFILLFPLLTHVVA